MHRAGHCSVSLQPASHSPRPPPQSCNIEVRAVANTPDNHTEEHRGRMCVEKLADKLHVRGFSLSLSLCLSLSLPSLSHTQAQAYAHPYTRKITYTRTRTHTHTHTHTHTRIHTRLDIPTCSKSHLYMTSCQGKGMWRYEHDHVTTPSTAIVSPRYVP
jgi:hypothetical protein